ncbi:hypothetical protein VNI00_001300 [Paramarasmius palmivorus]|uniref:CxC1-like cysteine cluster associated with KDZ transposases domain-containing protein n=1 Tax=Paramarasmius palmivorus TaxID=297713 RepID=A0AAW0EBG9_9AGAR
MGKRKRMTIHYGGVDGSDTIRRAGIDKYEERYVSDRSRHQALFNTLSFQQRDDVDPHPTDNNSINNPHPTDFSDDDSSIPLYNSQADDDEEWVDIPSQSQPPPTFPPGEEAAIMSHEGGEYGYHNFLRSFSDFTRLSDSRTRSDRIERQTKSWQEQLPHLTRAYLAFKAHGPPENTTSQPEWELRVMDFNFNGNRTLFQVSSDVFSTNESLVRHGIIGASPEHVSMGFSISLFEIYRQLHRVCNKLSIEALSKALQHIHQIPRDSHLDNQLRAAYDTYLMILREVDSACTAALGRQSRQAFFDTVCPPCRYALKDEPRLVPSMLMAIDGNNSLKMVDESFKYGNTREDSRQLPDHRWVEDEEVDQFKDEVARSQNKRGKKAQPATAVVQTADAVYPDLEPGKDDDIPWLNVNETEDLTACVDTCVDRWKNAGPESRKKMFAFFAISGVFLAVCRHGHLLAMCDMRRSGELMKYPLAIVNRLMDDFGLDLCVAYDIMCAFFKTLTRSRLGSKVKSSRLTGVVPAFHGHAHNRKCQLRWHPQYRFGVGIEDFEECERFFSRSNLLASLTRLATYFHRRQLLLQHFHFNDEDKHALSGNFIYQTYRRVVQRLLENTHAYHESLKRFEMTPTTCEDLLASEREHFENRNFPERPEVSEKIEYAELLEQFWKTKENADAVHEAYLAMTKNRSAHSADQIATSRARDRINFDKFQIAQEALLRFEDANPRERWTKDSNEYQEALKLRLERRYWEALEELELVVVQRLFELTKLDMSDIGYKQRDKITHALRARSEAIKKALARYNTVALQMRPKKRTLAWEEVIHLVTVAELDLLKDTHLDLSKTPWADPEKREVVRLHFSVLRAHEEIKRLHVEAKRLVTYMLDDHADYHLAIQSLKTSDYELASELERRHKYRLQIHARIAWRLAQTAQLTQLKENQALLPRLDLIPGERAGRDPTLTDSVPLPDWAVSVLGLTRGDGSETFNAAELPSEDANSDAHADPDLLDEEQDLEGLQTFWERLD